MYLSVDGIAVEFSATDFGTVVINAKCAFQYSAQN